MFDMMHTPTPGTTGSRTNDEPAAPTASPRRATFRRATLATAASLTMLVGAVTAATSPIAHAAPADPAAQTECEHVDDPARLDDAISRAIAEGHIAAGHDWAPNKALEFLPGNCGEVVAQPIAALGGEPSSPTALLLYHPVDGRYVTTAEVPGFVAEGPRGARTSAACRASSARLRRRSPCGGRTPPARRRRCVTCGIRAGTTRCTRKARSSPRPTIPDEGRAPHRARADVHGRDRTSAERKTCSTVMMTTLMTTTTAVTARTAAAESGR